ACQRETRRGQGNRAYGTHNGCDVQHRCGTSRHGTAYSGGNGDYPPPPYGTLTVIAARTTRVETTPIRLPG
ncbi:MAG TPA: hypothetical protein VKT83_17295, partial [bacterium]|nr:hypothetical protein [bacterium]